MFRSIVYIIIASALLAATVSAQETPAADGKNIYEITMKSDGTRTTASIYSVVDFSDSLSPARQIGRAHV